VLDPTITLSLPAKLTAATGIDAFVHNLEAYIMEVFHPMADGMAKEAMEMCVNSLNTAVTDGGNVVARGKMLMASAMGAIAFQKGLGLNHAIAHALGAMFDIHHGLANAIVLTEVMRYNMTRETTKARYASLGSIFGVEDDAVQVIEAIENWVEELGMNVKLSELGITENDLEAIENYAIGDPCYPLNPKVAEKGDVVKILKNIL
jgi:alcohol dehydrogenase class IV